MVVDSVLEARVRETTSPVTASTASFIFSFLAESPSNSTSTLARLIARSFPNAFKSAAVKASVHSAGVSLAVGSGSARPDVVGGGVSEEGGVEDGEGNSA